MVSVTVTVTVNSDSDTAISLYPVHDLDDIHFIKLPLLLLSLVPQVPVHVKFISYLGT